MLWHWLLFQLVISQTLFIILSIMNFGYITLKSVLIDAASVDNSTTSTATQQDKGFDPTGWELALVAAPSNNTNSLATDNNLVGFFSRTLQYLSFAVFFTTLD